MSELILYTTEDGRSQIKLRAKDQTVWLSQREMAQLFDVSTDNVGLHLKNIFAGGCYVFRYLSRRTAFYPTVIRRDLENVFL
ncbi:hypothetical protein [Acidithiobacillus thiooxidans]|uniref:hypothetical protein n=1 Tax=Acidithiobacillus thiooxidans TaxID=930 RepID=UPI000826E92E|nr:hypothetical protein [Acidithiobacillus thiooxidans]OCX79860.1 hypothetical protein A6P08_17270 [Acidithiobacillus thiooxidans]